MRPLQDNDEISPHQRLLRISISGRAKTNRLNDTSSGCGEAFRKTVSVVFIDIQCHSLTKQRQMIFY